MVYLRSAFWDYLARDVQYSYLKRKETFNERGY